MPLLHAWPRTPAISSPIAEYPSLLQHGRHRRKVQQDCGCTLLDRVGGEKVASVVSLQPQEECDLECVVPGGPAARGWQLCKLLVIEMEIQAGEGSRNRLTSHSG